MTKARVTKCFCQSNVQNDDSQHRENDGSNGIDHRIDLKIVLGDDKDLEDIITEDIIEDSVEDTENNQQILDLEEDIIEETTDEIIDETTEAIAEVTAEIEPIVNIVPEKIVLDLEPEINVSDEQEESAEQLITSILMEEETQEELPMILDMENEEITENESTLNTIESTEVNADSMKVEARERESRLRAILAAYPNILMKKQTSAKKREKVSSLSGFASKTASKFVKNIPVCSEGFEVETELTLHALQKKFIIQEVPIHYRDRPQGSHSKLNTISDGLGATKRLYTAFLEVSRFFLHYLQGG